MNPHRCKIALRPRGPFESFDLAWRFLRERIGPLARLGAVVLLLPWLALSVAAWWFGGHLGVLIPAVLIALAARAPFTLLAGRLLFDDEARVRDVLRDLVERLPALIAAWSLRVAGLLVGLVSCGIALPWVQGMLLYVVETALLERVPPARGLRRSARLAGGHPGDAAAGVLVSALLVGWFAGLGEASGQALVGFVFQLGQPFGAATSLQVTPYLLAGLFLAQPIVAVYRLLLYVDVRTRVEGWDLQVGLRAAGLAS